MNILARMNDSAPALAILRSTPLKFIYAKIAVKSSKENAINNSIVPESVKQMHLENKTPIIVAVITIKNGIPLFTKEITLLVNNAGLLE